MTATFTKTAQTSTERAFNILAGICEARNLPIIYSEQHSARGSMVFDKHIIIRGNLTAEERLDTLLDLLAQREMSGKTGAYHSVSKRNNPFARLAKTLMCELLDESEGF